MRKKRSNSGKALENLIEQEIKILSQGLKEEDLKSKRKDFEKKAKERLLRLIPWRKGPFNIGNVFIDAEWRSNMKWDRILGLNIELLDEDLNQ